MTPETSFESQVDVLTKGIKDIALHAEALKAELAEVRKECGRLAKILSDDMEFGKDEPASRYVRDVLVILAKEEEK